MQRTRAPVAPIAEPDVPEQQRTLAGLVRYFLRLGSSGFGGPIALVGYMQRDLVESRGWFTEAEYRQGLALAQTMPGPLAAQLAMWFGFLEAGVLGAAAVAVPFVAPACVLVTAVAVLYAKYQDLCLAYVIHDCRHDAEAEQNCLQDGHGTRGQTEGGGERGRGGFVGCTVRARPTVPKTVALGEASRELDVSGVRPALWCRRRDDDMRHCAGLRQREREAPDSRR
jgi:hypothetical protein